MPKPTEPQQYGAGTTSSVTTFGIQPYDWDWLPPPTAGRRDGGSVIHGLRGIRLKWKTLTPAHYDILVNHYNGAVGQAGLYYLKYWDERQNNGTGGYITDHCVIRNLPVGAHGGGLNYYDVSMEFEALGIP
jgi:hypothetical protein